VTCCTAEGSCWTPRDAIVAKASVISSGVTEFTPSVIEQTGESLVSMPMRWATSATFAGPTVTASCAKMVLTELARALDMGMVPCPESP
jgi:hypothetical protein